MQNNLKQLFRKKFELLSCDSDSTMLHVVIKLTHFYQFNKSHFEVSIDDKNVHFELQKLTTQTYKVAIPTQQLSQNDHQIDFYYKGQKLWVVSSLDHKQMIHANENIYTIEVNQSLQLTRFITNYKYHSDVYHMSLSNTSEHAVKLNTNAPLDSILLLNRYESIEVPVNEQNEIDIQQLQKDTKAQSYKVFGINQQHIFPIWFDSYYFSYFLCMKHEWQNDEVRIQSNKLDVEMAGINSFLDDTTLNVRLIMQQDLNQATIFDTEEAFVFDTLALMDSNFNTYYELAVEVEGETIFTHIPLTYFDSSQTKKLVAVYKEIGTQNKRVLLINPQKISKFEDYYRVHQEVFSLKTIKRNGLTFVSKKPKNRLGIHWINESQMSCYYQPHTIYSSFNHYLTFEERVSGQAYHIPIGRGEHIIDIPYEHIEAIKTMPKTVIDIFITIYNQDTLVRKDKIKYRNVEYKKDDILSLKHIKTQGKGTYYMATITPFGNIKLETFAITETEKSILDQGELDANVWLIGERTDTAQDNGIALFKWLREHTHIEAYYVIDELSQDYDKIKEDPHVLRFGSQAHFEVVSRAKVLICTHDLENIVPFKTAAPFWNYKDTVKVFLQHGIMGRKNVEYHKQYYQVPFDLFNVTSTKEKENVAMAQLGYDDAEVAVTGLSRFDRLPLQPERKLTKILLMPTWRDWLNSDFAFENSDYLKRYLDLINDPTLLAFLEEHDLELNFYPHYRAQSFFQQYVDEMNARIHFVELGERTVQDLLIEHDLLITDYSSVSFDFSYMNKPVIFYHFDVARFFRKGILRPIHETFIGSIAYNNKELIHKIQTVVTEGGQPAQSDLSEVFDHIDHHNNERVYNAIVDKVETNA
ncbi:CDP-glycerol glycerophosphotransferase family protein [Staphylococcus sp. 11261D007BR]